MKRIATHLYQVEPSERYPRGGIRIIVPAWGGGKKQQTLSIADYSSKRKCLDAAEELRLEFKKNAPGGKEWAHRGSTLFENIQNISRCCT